MHVLAVRVRSLGIFFGLCLNVFLRACRRLRVAHGARRNVHLGGDVLAQHHNRDDYGRRYQYRDDDILHHNRALLLCDQGEFADFKWNNEQTAAAVGITPRTLINLKERFVMGGLKVALQRKPYKQRQKVFDGAFEAKIIQIACSEAPEGRSRWTLQLIADKAVELKIVDSVSIMTIHRVLKKTLSNPI